MKKILNSIALVLLLLVGSACLRQTEKDVPVPGRAVFEQVLTATLEGGEGTRTSLSEPENGVYYPYWKESDELAVFDEGSARAGRFVLQSGAGTDKAQFAGPAVNGPLVGFYPYSGVAEEGLSNHVLTLELPAVQHYVQGSYDDGAYPMLAVSRVTNLAFKNLCAILRLSMTGSDAVESIRFISYDTHLPASGKATVRTDFSSVPELVMNAGGSQEVILQCDAVRLDPEVPTEFFLVIPAGTYHGGFEVQIVASAGRTVRRIHSDVTFERSQYRSIPQFDFDQVAMPLNYPEPVDLGLSVKWSSFNLGATAPEGRGDYYAWAETDLHYSSLDPVVWKEGREGYGAAYGGSYKWYTWETDENGSICWAGWDSKYMTDGRTTLEPEDDAAYVNLGGAWRTPTHAELTELTDLCHMKFEAENGVDGVRVIGPNGNSIFIPYVGYWFGSDCLYPDIQTVLMAADLDKDGKARYLAISGCIRYYSNPRGGEGVTVRPVYRDKETVFVKGVSLNQTSLKLSVSESATLTATVRPADASIRLVHWSSSDESIVIVDDRGIVTGISPGSAVVTATSVDGELTATCQVAVLSTPYSLAVPDAVDLGLSVQWASFNLGAKAPEESGFFYAWGETEPYYTYYLLNPNSSQYRAIWKEGKDGGYRDTSYSSDLMSKYGPSARHALEPEDDAAHVKLGGNWRMPTAAEMTELLEKCTWTETTVGGMACWEVAGPSGNSIILPAYGMLYSIAPFWPGTLKYWTSSLCTYCAEGAQHLDYPGNLSNGSRVYGMPIRPVFGGAVVPVTGVTLNETTLELSVNETATLAAAVHPDNATNKGVTWSTDRASVAMVSPAGVVTGISPGTATITSTGEGGKTATCRVTVRTHTYAVPELVDLGLSVPWASFNLGASSPQDYGDYFAWGETEPYYSRLEPLAWKPGRESGYDWPSYKWCAGDEATLLKYSSQADYGYCGFVDNKTVLDPEDDAAHVLLGEGWRMPTYEEMQELVDQCIWEQAVQNGVHGRKVTGPSGNSIFLPAAGRWGYQYLNASGTEGGYWTSSLSDYPHIARGLNYWSDEISTLGNGRIYGYSIRPVHEKPEIHVEGVTLNYTEVTLSLNGVVYLHESVYPENARNKAVYWDSNNKSVAKVDITGMVVGISPGTAVITATSLDGGKTATCHVVVEAPPPPPVKLEAVDLGLSVRWANMNLGADKPEENGDYYAWGEKYPHYRSLDPLVWWEGKDGYDWPSYSLSGPSFSSLTKYCNDPTWGLDGFSDERTVLEWEDDAARFKLGETWRIPTWEELQELQTKCQWEWKGNGYTVTGPNGRSIFLPAAGIFSWMTLAEEGPNGLWGMYWSSSLDLEDAHKAFNLHFDKYAHIWTFDLSHDRYLGFSIRPVLGDE